MTVSTRSPLVSVVMPVYNAERYVAEAVRSVRSQTYPHWELIVALDGATDGSERIARELAAADGRIRVLGLPHRGSPDTLNAAADAARGRYIAHLDADDIAVPERLEAQIAGIERHGLDLCGGWARELGGAGRLLWFPEGVEAVRRELLFRVALLPSTTMARAGALRAFPYAATPLTQYDYALYARMAPSLRLGNLPQVLAQYRRHPAQMSVVHLARARENMALSRRPYFFALYPGASEEDLDAVTRIAEDRPFASLEGLRRAGGWLLRLSDLPDPLLRARMARRWHDACRRSAHLGPACYRLYREIAPGLGDELPDARRLRVQCALRLASGAPLCRWASSARRSWRTIRHAAS